MSINTLPYQKYTFKNLLNIGIHTHFDLLKTQTTKNTYHLPGDVTLLQFLCKWIMEKKKKTLLTGNRTLLSLKGEGNHLENIFACFPPLKNMTGIYLWARPQSLIIKIYWRFLIEVHHDIYGDQKLEGQLGGGIFIILSGWWENKSSQFKRVILSLRISSLALIER